MTEFKRTYQKDIQGKRMFCYRHLTKEHKLEVTFQNNCHKDDEGAALIEVEKLSGDVEATVWIYLNPIEVQELGHILLKGKEPLNKTNTKLQMLHLLRSIEGECKNNKKTMGEAGSVIHHLVKEAIKVGGKMYE